jgi:DNA-binding NtrC family response regulator
VSDHVLVIDDDAAVRSILRDALGNEGYRVQTAASAGEALRMVDTNPPALILLDMRMPDDGPRFKKELQRRADGAPIIGMSASSGAREWADSIGIAFVAKPFDLEELLAVAKEASNGA